MEVIEVKSSWKGIVRESRQGALKISLQIKMSVEIVLWKKFLKIKLRLT